MIWLFHTHILEHISVWISILETCTESSSWYLYTEVEYLEYPLYCYSVVQSDKEPATDNYTDMYLMSQAIVGGIYARCYAQS